MDFIKPSTCTCVNPHPLPWVWVRVCLENPRVAYDNPYLSFSFNQGGLKIKNLDLGFQFFFSGLSLNQPANVIRHISILGNMMSSLCNFPSSSSHQPFKPNFWVLVQVKHILDDTTPCGVSYEKLFNRLK